LSLIFTSVGGGEVTSLIEAQTADPIISKR